jgi:transposase-like protein
VTTTQTVIKLKENARNYVSGLDAITAMRKTKRNKLPLRERLVCKKCGSRRFIKRGVRKTKVLGTVQRYQCKKCHSTFSSSGPYMCKIKTPREVIILILASHISGMSSRQTKRECWERYRYYISHTSIVRYINYIKQGGG